MKQQIPLAKIFSEKVLHVANDYVRLNQSNLLINDFQADVLETTGSSLNSVRNRTGSLAGSLTTSESVLSSQKAMMQTDNSLARASESAGLSDSSQRINIPKPIINDVIMEVNSQTSNSEGASNSSD